MKQTDYSDDFIYCAGMLQKVSRTFAINIEFLKSGNEKVYRAVLCGYLFCRIIDTIEDSPLLDYSEKISLLESWAGFFPFEDGWENRLKKFIDGYMKKNNKNPADHETDLVINAPRVFNVFQELGTEVHGLLAPSVREMAKGMAEFQKKASAQGKKPACLGTMEEMEKYCYYVAGTVGNFLKAIFFHFHPEIKGEAREIMEKTAVSFGLGLQITNIIKDFRDDSIRDWSYIPLELLKEAGLDHKTFLTAGNNEKKRLVLSGLVKRTKEHLDRALEFSLAIPGRIKALRIFCLLPLHFAIQTLNQAMLWAKNPGDKKIKITRSAVTRTIIYVRLFYYSDFMQRIFFRFYRSKG